MKTVAILLATYKPDWQFFEQQLQSIQQQSYPYCVLYVRDDSQSNEWFEQIKATVANIVTRFPVKISRNANNIGSTKTFELLTNMAQEDYFAYCDQDDKWHTSKIDTLVRAMEHYQAVVSYSDLRVINESNQVIAERFSKYNRRIKHVFGKNTFSFFIRRNCITGCAMMIRKDVAKSALPFYDAYVHDHWLALIGSTKGYIHYIDTPLIDYRIHAANQIGKSILKQVIDRQSYVSSKLLPEKKKFDTLLGRLPTNDLQKKHIEKELLFIKNRINWFEKRNMKHFFNMCRHLTDDFILTGFELLMNCLPEQLANQLINKLKN